MITRASSNYSFPQSIPNQWLLKQEGFNSPIHQLWCEARHVHVCSNDGWKFEFRVAVDAHKGSKCSNEMLQGWRMLEILKLSMNNAQNTHLNWNSQLIWHSSKMLNWFATFLKSLCFRVGHNWDQWFWSQLRPTCECIKRKQNFPL